MNHITKMKGPPVKVTEQDAQSPSQKTGLLALLRAFLHIAGSGAPSRGCRVSTRLAGALVLTLATLAFGATSAEAAVQFPVLGEVSGPAAGERFGSFNSESVAVNDFNGHVMVADSGAHVVYDFVSAADTAPAVWSGAAVPVGSLGAGSFGGGHVSVAVDSESGDVYVADTVDLVIDKFDAEGNYLCQITGLGSASSSPTECDKTLAGPPTGAFSHQDSQSPVGIAVDQATHQLYVIDSGHQAIDVFGATGVYEKQITAVPEGLYAEAGQYTDGIAVNAVTGSVFVAESGSERVFEFDALGVPVETKAFAGFVSVAVNDATGDFFVSSTSPPSVQAFKAGGAPVGQIEGVPGGAKGGVAVDQATGEIYVSDNASGSVKIFGPGVVVPEPVTGEAGGLQPSSATLHGTVNPEGVEVSDCHFDYGTTTAYGQSVPCAESPAEIGSGSAPVDVHADLSGLAVGTTYHFRLVAANANGSRAGADQTFSTPPPPAITGEAATNLTATTADLTANVNPGGLPIEACTFEYGTEAGVYPHKLQCTPPAAQLGSGSSPVPVSQHLTGLAHDTPYHWRILATNAAGTRTGVDHTFIYPTTGGGLPDGRAYEMVTPPAKNAALIGNIFLGLLPDYSADGSRLILTALQCFGDAGSCMANRGLEGSPYEFTRTPGGWVASALAPPASQFGVSSVLNVNADGGSALFSMPTPPHGEDDIYVRSGDGSFSDIGPVTPPEQGTQGLSGGLYLATANFSHVVVGLRSLLWPFAESERFVLEYVAGSSLPRLVGVRGGVGSNDVISVCSTELGAGPAAASSSSALSSDGELVFFTAGRCEEQGVHAAVASDEVWARVGGAESVELSASACGSGGGVGEVACRAAEAAPADAAFQGASVDGSKAFFTSTQQLTDSASEDSNETDSASKGCTQTTGVNGCNLYEYDMGLRRLTAVSAGAGAGGPRVQGVMAVSSDGSHVYFVAKGVLSSVVNGRGQLARDGGENLYVFERDGTHPEGQVSFIATLSDAAVSQGADLGQWLNADSFANVSSDGRFLVFTSQAPLTGDDTRVDGGAAQVFRYDALDGALVRVSVGEGSFNDNGNAGTGDASIVAGGALTEFVGGSGRRDPSMSDDGRRVFFMSPVALVPGALDDVVLSEASGRVEYAQNIYEFEGGRVSLISSGRDVSAVKSPTCRLTSSVCLVGSDVSGSNVFFTTTEQLVPGDTDTQLDFYDARVCTTVSPCVSAVPAGLSGCAGEECHGVPVAQPGGLGGGSATLSGLGNLPPGRPGPVVLTRAQKLSRTLKVCRHVHPRARGLRVACERRARKHFGPKPKPKKPTRKAKKAAHVRGVGAFGVLGGVAFGGVL
jgi:DNA-binding beta-propeller fold protein YncE